MQDKIQAMNSVELKTLVNILRASARGLAILLDISDDERLTARLMGDIRNFETNADRVVKPTEVDESSPEEWLQLLRDSAETVTTSFNHWCAAHLS